MICLQLFLSHLFNSFLRCPQNTNTNTKVIFLSDKLSYLINAFT